jgi:hypothetical protein
VEDFTRLPVNASLIVFSNTSLVFETRHDQLFGTTPLSLDSLNLTILYEVVRVRNRESFSGLKAIFLQIGHLSLPRSGDWMFCICGMDYEHCITRQSSKVKSMIVIVPSVGSSWIIGFSDRISGFIETDECWSVLTVGSNLSFVGNGRFVLFPATDPPTASAAVTATATATGAFTMSLLSGYRPRRRIPNRQ